jgi:anti-sigma-K factor RskA
VTHDELQSLLGAYALDALDPAETAVLEAHLTDCPRCRAEVAGHHQTAALLGNVGGDAPRGVWERIAAELHPEQDMRSPPPLSSKVLSLPSRRPLPLPLVAALVAAAIAVVGLLGVFTIRLQHRVDALRAAISTSGLRQAAAGAVLNPHHTSAQLTSADGRLTAQVVIGPDGNAYLLDADLPPLDPLRTYQLWGLDNGRIVSLALLGNDPKLAAFRVDPAVRRLMVTAEPRGGRPQPGGNILMQGDIPT